MTNLRENPSQKLTWGCRLTDRLKCAINYYGLGETSLNNLDESFCPGKKVFCLIFMKKGVLQT